jgi:hypothetical protein
MRTIAGQKRMNIVMGMTVGDVCCSADRLSPKVQADESLPQWVHRCHLNLHDDSSGFYNGFDRRSRSQNTRARSARGETYCFFGIRRRTEEFAKDP